MSQRGKGTILVVDDEAALRELIGEILKDNGYEVLCASSGEDALRVWEESSQPIELVVTDLVMPGTLRGEDLVTELRDRKPEVRVIYTTGYSEEAFEGRKVTLRRGVNFLQKPYPPAELVQLVQGLLSRDSEP